MVNPDNTFEVLVDQTVVNSGSLLTDMTPPVNPPAEIEDPDDQKPEDWDERPKIQDPSATKPEDWSVHMTVHSGYLQTKHSLAYYMMIMCASFYMRHNIFFFVEVLDEVNEFQMKNRIFQNIIAVVNISVCFQGRGRSRSDSR